VVATCGIPPEIESQWYDWLVIAAAAANAAAFCSGVGWAGAGAACRHAHTHAATMPDHEPRRQAGNDTRCISSLFVNGEPVTISTPSFMHEMRVADRRRRTG